jgi:hypothetical protein
MTPHPTSTNPVRSVPFATSQRPAAPNVTVSAPHENSCREGELPQEHQRRRDATADSGPEYGATPVAVPHQQATDDEPRDDHRYG